MKKEDELFERIAELYTPYKSETEKLRELQSKVYEQGLKIKKLESFCLMQAEMNSDLCAILKDITKL